MMMRGSTSFKIKNKILIVHNLPKNIWIKIESDVAIIDLRQLLLSVIVINFHSIMRNGTLDIKVDFDRCMTEKYSLEMWDPLAFRSDICHSSVLMQAIYSAQSRGY